MANSHPSNRLFTADASTLVLYNGTLPYSELDSETPKLFDMLAVFRTFHLNEETLEEDGSATWDAGSYPLPYRQKWTAEVEMCQDLDITGLNYDSIYHMFMSVGVGPYWLLFQKKYVTAIKAAPFAMLGHIKNFSEILSGDGPQTQTVSFSLWGVPQPIPTGEP